MTTSAVARTGVSDATEAGVVLGNEIRQAFGPECPDVVIVFASSHYNYAALLNALQRTCTPTILTGCSSAGEITDNLQMTQSAVAIGLRSSEMTFACGLGCGLQSDRVAVAQQVVSSFAKAGTHSYPYRTALIFADSLAGYTEELIEQLTILTAGDCQLIGGGAGDDAQFQRTHVFYGTQAHTDAVVALEILSHKPVGIGMSHCWKPGSEPLRVTEAQQNRLVSLNAISALEVFQEHAERTGQTLDLSDPLPFFLHNVLGIETKQGYILRVPLGILPDGSVHCAAAIPQGALVRIMTTSGSSAQDAAASATRAALQQLEGHQPEVALFFDCVATRLRLGQDFDLELQAVSETLDSAKYVGCNTYGQILRAEGQFNGFHNCNAVVCVLPR